MPLKMTWNMKLFSCFSSKTLPLDLQSHVSKPHSSQRISLSDISDLGSFSAEDISNCLIGSNLHIFTFSELKIITNDFSSVNFLGEGGFGPVYKGFLDDKIRPGLEAQPVAVKLLDLDGAQGYREWLAELVFLGQLRHPHLVTLIGYCCDDEQRLLVYEYMERGNLESLLFKRYSIPLPWLTRIQIALGAAKGLAFLHGEEKPVIHRDFKASNILLDSDYTAKIADFGLARDGLEGDQTDVVSRIMGTHGYAAPEYIMTGHLTTMSDVYSFGVVLLELITGKKALDKNRASREKDLVKWARPMLKDPLKLETIIDTKLEGQYSFEGAKKVATLAYQCLNRNPRSRPTMSNVVKVLKPILDLNQIQVTSFGCLFETEGRNGKIEANAEKQEVDVVKIPKEKESGYHQYRKARKNRHHVKSQFAYSDTALVLSTPQKER
ncbi:hypothetical protein LIER_22729 [Lithospermum erythrorhizon]|uniref:non-specific serine/threonine protein kinase n=1 Tax=Lithospermum erythrorhizon TaxID=34254 RepID=A0AAV3QV23_LITER